MYERRNEEEIARQLAHLPFIIDFAKEIYFPNRERTFEAEVANDEGEVVQRTYVLPPWAYEPYNGMCAWCGDQRSYPNYKDLPSPIRCPSCVGTVRIAADIAIPLTEAASSIEAEVETLEAARKHINECRLDFEMRRNVATGLTPSQSRGSRDPISANDVFGYDHYALEGYASYEASLRKVLTDEIISLKRKSSLVKDAPLPPSLLRVKEEEADRAKAEAAENKRKAAAIAAKAKAKARSNSLGPSTTRTRKASLERAIADRGRSYADVVKISW